MLISGGPEAKLLLEESQVSQQWACICKAAAAALGKCGFKANKVDGEVKQIQAIGQLRSSPDLSSAFHGHHKLQLGY